VFKSNDPTVQRIKPGELYRYGNVVTQAPLFVVLRVLSRSISTKKNKVESLIFTDREWINEDNDDIDVHKVPKPLIHEAAPFW